VVVARVDDDDDEDATVVEELVAPLVVKLRTPFIVNSLLKEIAHVGAAESEGTL
jgi:hypothetical protein